MRRTDGLAWAAWLAGTYKRRHDVEGGDELLKRGCEAVSEERQEPRETCFGGCNDLFGHSSVRPTTAAIINNNLGAKLIQTYGRPSSPSGMLAPVASVPRAYVHSMSATSRRVTPASPAGYIAGVG